MTGEFVALILAAGKSSRMGFPKALLQFEGQSLLRRVATTCVNAGARAVVVVVGKHDEGGDTVESAAWLLSETAAWTELGDFAKLRQQPGSRPIFHVAVGAPGAHPIDSIRAGLRRVVEMKSGAKEGRPDLMPELPPKLPFELPLLLWPIDHPFATESLIRAMIDRLRGQSTHIVAPSVAGRRAHPILVGAEVVSELLSQDADGGAHLVVRRDASRIILVESDDPRLVADLNTPAQAEALQVMAVKPVGSNQK